MDKKMGFVVRHLDHALLLGAALAALTVGQQALADGDSSKALAPPPPPRISTTGSVSVDMSALDSVPNRRLLLPGAGGEVPQTEGPIRLRPPPGVKPIAQAPIRLRPPPGVQAIVPAPAKAPETKMASVTPPPARTAPAQAAPKAEAPKPVAPVAAPPVAPPAKAPPAPAAKAAPPPATPAAPAPKTTAAAPVSPTPAPPPAPKQTQVAVASPPPATPAAPAPGQPRSLLTPPPAQTAPAQTATVSAAPAAPPAKTEDTKPAETAVAALPPPAKTPVDAGPLVISFKIGGADVPADATAGLKALAARLAKDPTARLQLVAFASDAEKSISRSRRLSLERAVNVRKVMLAAGIESTRIDIRALGEQSGNGAPDRVDVITVKR